MQASLVEIGEQLAWLGAALQRSPDPTKMAYTTARIVILRPTPPRKTTSVQAATISMKIHFMTVVLSEVNLEPAQTGCCWHLLFQNPVIVQGYPISPRTHEEKGLEISLDLMAGLGNANYLTEFHGIPVLKGFFTMFVATACSDDSLVWHFLCSKNEKRMPYSEALRYYPDGTTGPKPNYPTGNTIRHFVGWAPSVRRLAGKSREIRAVYRNQGNTGNVVLTIFIFKGTHDVIYDDIEQSRSEYCSAGCVLQNLSFTAGKYITFSGTIGPGIRNQRLVTFGDRAYVEAVKYTRQNIYVNIYDVEESRGWLFDGASVVLHLSRTQLSHNASPLSRNPVLELQALHLATGEGGAEAAVAALTDEHNLRLEIAVEPPERKIEETITEGGAASKVIKETDKRMLFHELVKRNLCLFEKMSEHQKDLTESNGIINLQGINCNKLEGWDFLDLVSIKSSLKPQFHGLTPSGRSWVKFTRCINTINLLGRKFGPLIQPSQDAIQLCDRWKQVPTGEDFLATCVSTVDEICQKWGEREINAFQLVKGIYWHQTHLLFEKCQCIPGGEYVCDRAQILLPKMSRQKVRMDPFQHGEGAVIFGRGSGGTPPRKNIRKMLVKNLRAGGKLSQNRGSTPPNSASQVRTPGTSPRMLSQNCARASLNNASQRASTANHSNAIQHGGDGPNLQSHSQFTHRPTSRPIHRPAHRPDSQPERQPARQLDRQSTRRPDRQNAGRMGKQKED